MTARRQPAYQRESGHSAQCPCYLPCHDLLQAVNARMRQAISASRLHVWAGATWPWRRVSWSRHVLRRRQSGSSSGGREQGRVRRLGICTKRQRRDAGGNNQNDQSEADHGGTSISGCCGAAAHSRKPVGRTRLGRRIAPGAKVSYQLDAPAPRALERLSSGSAAVLPARPL